MLGRPAPRLVRDLVPHARAARRAGAARARNSPPPATPARPGSMSRSTFDPNEDIAAPFIATRARPRVAVLREQGVNSQIEMAAVFERVGFEPHDVHMSDVLAGPREARRLPRPRRLRRILLRRRARRRRGLGQVHPVSRRRARRSSSASSSAPTRSRWACATAARCSRRSRRSCPARRTGRVSCATAASSSKARFSLVELQRVAVDLPRRHGRLDAAHRRGAWRGPRRVRERRRRARHSAEAAWSRRATSKATGRSATDLPGEPQRLTVRHRRDHQRRRPRDDHHAASRSARSAMRRIPGAPTARANTRAGIRMFGNARKWVG